MNVGLFTTKIYANWVRKEELEMPCPHKCRALINFLPLFYNCSGDWSINQQ
jgi:hypothetical protein